MAVHIKNGVLAALAAVGTFIANAIRLVVARAGVLSYRKISATEYTKFGELTLENPSQTTV